MRSAILYGYELDDHEPNAAMNAARDGIVPGNGIATITFGLGLNIGMAGIGDDSATDIFDDTFDDTFG